MPHGSGVSKGAASLLLIGAFLAMRALRQEKALMSYDFFKSRPVHVRLHPETFAFPLRLLLLPFGLFVLFTPEEVVQVVVADLNDFLRSKQNEQPERQEKPEREGKGFRM